jgi:PAS domain S-box-containing protein
MMTATSPEAEQLRAVFENLGAGVYAIDLQGRITMANPWAQHLVMRTSAEMLGKNAHDLLHRRADGTTLPRRQCRIFALLSGGDPVEGGDEFFIRSDGAVIPIIWTATPLRREGRMAGVVVVFHDFNLHRAAVQETAEHLAALEELTARLSMIAEISAALASTLEIPALLDRLVRLLVPELGDWAAADLRDGEVGEMQRIAVYGPGLCSAQELTGSLPPLPPVSTSTSALTRVLHTGQPVLLDAAQIRTEPDSPLAAAHHRLFERLGGHSAVVVPLSTRRQIFGALTLARTSDSPAYTHAESAVLADIGRRTGLVIDNARLFDQQRHVAATMQRQLLTPLPQVGNLMMAARYQPAQSAAEIGGDWYDAFILADGVMALAIGDVVGHDLQAAAHMAEVRNMLRAVAWDRQGPPSLIMHCLDEAVTNISDVPMATVIFARLEEPEPGHWELHWVNAGHPPPLLITSDGHTRFLESGHGPLIGMSTILQLGASWVDAREPLPPDSTLLLYTDGLVEHRGRSIDTGLRLLQQHAVTMAQFDVEDICDQLLKRINPRGDDVALLALHLPPRADGTPHSRHTAHILAAPTRTGPPGGF